MPTSSQFSRYERLHRHDAVGMGGKAVASPLGTGWSSRSGDVATHAHDTEQRFGFAKDASSGRR